MSQGAKSAKHLMISGRVQGVFYRASARDAGIRLGLTGWVKNLRDGRVEAFAQGPTEDVDRFVEWCHEGPPMSRVGEVDVTDSVPDDRLNRFEVRYQ